MHLYVLWDELEASLIFTVPLHKTYTRGYDLILVAGKLAWIVELALAAMGAYSTRPSSLAATA